MLDYEWLSSWVQPQHLDDKVLKKHSETFKRSPARVVSIKNFLREEVAERLARFLTFEAKFSRKYGLFMDKDNLSDPYGVVPEDVWVNATEERRASRYCMLEGLPFETPVNSTLLMTLKLRKEFGYIISENLTTFLRFYIAFSHPNFTKLFEAISGTSLGESNLHHVNSMAVGDFVSPHDDYSENRRLTILLYLSPRWEPSFDGALKVIDPQGNIAKLEADYNSLVLFEVSKKTRHFVGPIKPNAEDRIRVSIGGWIHNPIVASKDASG